MELDKLEKKLKGNDRLSALADSPEGKALASRFRAAGYPAPGALHPGGESAG